VICGRVVGVDRIGLEVVVCGGWKLKVDVIGKSAAREQKDFKYWQGGYLSNCI
jgi:hypothetical protein